MAKKLVVKALEDHLGGFVEGFSKDTVRFSCRAACRAACRAVRAYYAVQSIECHSPWCSGDGDCGRTCCVAWSSRNTPVPISSVIITSTMPKYIMRHPCLRVLVAWHPAPAQSASVLFSAGGGARSKVLTQERGRQQKHGRKDDPVWVEPGYTCVHVSSRWARADHARLVRLLSVG